MTNAGRDNHIYNQMMQKITRNVTKWTKKIHDFQQGGLGKKNVEKMHIFQRKVLSSISTKLWISETQIRYRQNSKACPPENHISHLITHKQVSKQRSYKQATFH